MNLQDVVIEDDVSCRAATVGSNDDTILQQQTYFDFQSSLRKGKTDFVGDGSDGRASLMDFTG